MNDAIAPPPPLTAEIVHPVAFTGERTHFRRLVMRGAMLELFTLGFYRFWLATDMRRHLWSHTSADGDAPEYTGTAKELLIGFLFALAILVPIYLVYFFIGLEAERFQAFASIPLVVFFYLFTNSLYRARRYRMTRTVWRGVRFGMGGSGWAYAWRAAFGYCWCGHARVVAALVRGGAGTLQDAPHRLWQAAGDASTARPGIFKQAW